MAENIRSAPKLQELYMLISDNDIILDYLREKRLIDSCRTCKSCSMKIILSNNGKKAKKKEEWRCLNCLRIESIRKGSIFELSSNLLL